MILSYKLALYDWRRRFITVPVAQEVFLVFLAGLQDGTVSYQVGCGLEGKVVS